MEDKLKKYSIYGKLDELEKELQGNDFIRIHQSYLVNMKHIEKVSRYEALLNNGIKLEIPKAHKHRNSNYSQYLFQDKLIIK